MYLWGRTDGRSGKGAEGASTTGTTTGLLAGEVGVPPVGAVSCGTRGTVGTGLDTATF